MALVCVGNPDHYDGRCEYLASELCYAFVSPPMGTPLSYNCVHAYAKNRAHVFRCDDVELSHEYLERAARELKEAGMFVHVIRSPRDEPQFVLNVPNIRRIAYSHEERHLVFYPDTTSGPSRVCMTFATDEEYRTNLAHLSLAYDTKTPTFTTDYSAKSPLYHCYHRSAAPPRIARSECDNEEREIVLQARMAPETRRGSRKRRAPDRLVY